MPGACSLHANSARDALVKLCTLPLLAGRNIDAGFVVPTVASAVDLVVHCELLRDGRRRVKEVIAPTGALSASAAEGGVIEAVRLFALDGGVLRPTGGLPPKEEKLLAAGFEPARLIRAAA